MPSFIIGEQNATWTFAEGDIPHKDRGFWSRFGGTRGTSVVRTGGVWASVQHPTTDQMNAADLITFPDGRRDRAVLLGGHVSPVTQAIADELTAQGFGAHVFA